VNSNPESDIYIKLTTSIIKRFYKNHLNESPSEKSIFGYYGFIIKLALRSCIIGEVYLEGSNTCFPCPEGKFSLDETTKGSCKNCPAGAECPGGAEILPKKGNK
jgi:hypothetical protein